MNGQRHAFEGPDPQTTARFAQRWADQVAGRAPVTAGDIQRRIGPPPGQFARDLTSRTRGNVDGLNAAIDYVRSHPTDFSNAPRVLGAVGNYASNALGIPAAALIDQVTGPVARGLNRGFGSHFDPHYASDQLVNAAGVLAGSAPGAFRALGGARVAETASLARAAPEATTVEPVPEPVAAAAAPPAHAAGKRYLTAEDGFGQPGEAPSDMGGLGYLPAGLNAAMERVVPLSDAFNAAHEGRLAALADAPEDVQDAYHEAVTNLVFDPYFDDPDFRGHTADQVMEVRRELQALSGHHRAGGLGGRLADALDSANEDFRTMVNQQQPDMGVALGLADAPVAQETAAPSNILWPEVWRRAPEVEAPPPKVDPMQSDDPAVIWRHIPFENQGPALEAMKTFRAPGADPSPPDNAFAPADLNRLLAALRDPHWATVPAYPSNAMLPMGVMAAGRASDPSR